MEIETAIQSETKVITVSNSRPIQVDTLYLQRASVEIVHCRNNTELSRETKLNLITNAGRAQYHKQCFGTSGLSANGMNYIALSNDALTETSASTTLSNEIASNGLQRAQGNVVLATGIGTQTTISKVFTASGTQSCQKMALFDAPSSGVMNHALAFTQRTLISGDTLTITVTITLS